ncbi:MAG TPA: YebC/PmpR family DNA-binding transcriptional regulator [Anaerolineae bacterium]|nr:YebC/PmpR family DNA-binding transcriptional regulator [Anaerolineae bacterium]
MSGHSKWSTIKRKKAAQDAKRGQLFTKLAREITVAARQGGGDPETNFTLRLAIERAKQANMPKENIERAIKRGTGELRGEALEELIYEGYAPHGIALILHVVTDNRNRAVADIRRVLNRNNGRLGESGSVTWLFDQKGYIAVETDALDPEELALLAIDAGAEDVDIGDALVEVYTAPEDFQKVKEVFERENIPLASAELSMIPKSTMRLSEKDTFQVMRLIEALESLDDVQQVYSNLDISDELMTRYDEKPSPRPGETRTGAGIQRGEGFSEEAA